jgi:hypothetical protein
MLMSDVISNNATVADFQNQLGSARATRIGLANKINADMDAVQGVIDARENLLEMFTAQAITQDPTLINADIFRSMASRPAFDPVVVLWGNYSDAIRQAAIQIVQGMNRVSGESDALFVAEQLESNLLSGYNAFQKKANTPVPTTAEIQAALPPVPVVPTDTTALIASVPAIEQLSPEAAAMVTTQIVDIQNSQQPAASGQQPLPVSATPGINLWGLTLAAGGLFYVLLGG